jgi:ribosomal protein S27AE
MDPLHRLKLAQQQLKHHPGKTCPKCGEPTLSFIDVHDDSRDRVTRTWTCSKDRYTSSAVGIPIAEWASNMRSAWEAKAALLRANKQIIRCPDCGNESIEAEESGVDRIGTSQHIRLSCKTPGCTFQKRETPRSIWGTVKASIRSVALLAIVGAGLFGTAYVLRTTTNPPAMSPQPSSTSVSSTQAPALSSTFSAPPSAQPPASGSAIAAPAQAADCTKASLPAFVLGAAQIDAGEFEEIDSAKFELTRITNLLSAEEKPQLWVNAAKVLERSSTGAPTRWVVALVNVRPSNEPAFCAWLKCQGWSSCQLARRQP